MSTDSKVAIITGASQGIGEGLVRGYLARGYRVVANSRSIKPDAFEGEILAVAGDITDEAGVQAAGFDSIDLAIDTSGKTAARQAAIDALSKRGALVARGYWNDPDKTAERFRPLPGQRKELPITELAVWSGEPASVAELI